MAIVLKLASLFPADHTWMDGAACRDEDPELFYAVGDSGPALLQIAEAKAVCRRCPGIADCLAWALADGADGGHGVWGGMSEKERRALRAAKARKRPAEVAAIHPNTTTGPVKTKRKSA